MSDVVPIKKEDQLAFEGMSVGETRFSLRSASNLFDPHPLGLGAHVKGTFSGVVDGVNHVRTKDGAVVRIHAVTVLDADITQVVGNVDDPEYDPEESE